MKIQTEEGNAPQKRTHQLILTRETNYRCENLKMHKVTRCKQVSDKDDLKMFEVSTVVYNSIQGSMLETSI